MPKVSVIVPIYNVEAFLERCVNSLINQSLFDIEIILVDDGSKDNCPAICDKYAKKDKRIRVIHKENGGVSAARNDGLSLATGEWVFFCDSDDWMQLDALESLYEVGIKTNVEVVMGDINRIEGQEIIYNCYFGSEFTYFDRKDMNNLVMTNFYKTYCTNPPQKSKTGFYGGPWNKLIRRELLNERGISFDTSLYGVYDDVLFSAYVYAYMDSITYIQKPIYNYVMLPTSLTKSYKKNFLEINDHIFSGFSKFKALFAPDGEWDIPYDAMVIRRFDEALRYYFFSTVSPQKLSYRLNKLRKVMREEPYLSAAKNVEMNKLMPYHRIVAFLLKRRSAIGLWLLYSAKIIIKQIIRKI